MVDPVSLDLAQLQALAREDVAAGSQKAPHKSFGDVLQDLVRETDDLQKLSDGKMQGFAAGQVEDVHDVMIAMTKADLSFRMMLEVRNKLVEAYQEVMRMQV